MLLLRFRIPITNPMRAVRESNGTNNLQELMGIYQPVCNFRIRTPGQIATWQLGLIAGGPAFGVLNIKLE